MPAQITSRCAHFTKEPSHISVGPEGTGDESGIQNIPPRDSFTLRSADMSSITSVGTGTKKGTSKTRPLRLCQGPCRKTCRSLWTVWMMLDSRLVFLLVYYAPCLSTICATSTGMEYLYQQPMGQVDVPGHVYANPSPWPLPNRSETTYSVCWQRCCIGQSTVHTPFADEGAD